MQLPDFYELPNGSIVFTEAYHLKRGYCCGSGCLHCPYVGGKGSTRLAEPSSAGESLPSELAWVQCPYCFEKFELPVSQKEGSHQRFVYDCEICCHPIDCSVSWKNHQPRVRAIKGNGE